MPKILVIDDEADMRFASGCFWKDRHTVLEAGMRSALAAIDEGPDLVLSHAPSGQTIKFSEDVKSERSPIIMVTVRQRGTGRQALQQAPTTTVQDLHNKNC